jgi:hypothetical protein
VSEVASATAIVSEVASATAIVSEVVTATATVSEVVTATVIVNVATDAVTVEIGVNAADTATDLTPAETDRPAATVQKPSAHGDRLGDTCLISTLPQCPVIFCETDFSVALQGRRSVTCF